MNRLPCLVAALLSIATAALAEEQLPIFRYAVSCSELGKEGICAFGKFPQGRAVTVITKDWKSSAMPQEEFPNTDFDNGIETITRLRAARPVPPGTGMIVAVAPAESVQLVRQMEIHDERITERVRKYVQQTKGTDEDPDRKYRINTRLIKLLPAVLIAEATVT